MNFAVFQPPQAKGGKKVPLVTFLSGLTCTEENFTVKAGAQRVAAELGLMLLMPDTSPRGAGYPGEDDAYDFRSEEHTSELQSLMRISYAVFCLKKTHIIHFTIYYSYYIHLILY